MFRFRPQQGLTIMNFKGTHKEKKNEIFKSFRPQQGLTIMNSSTSIALVLQIVNIKFPSPTGVNYYESVAQVI